MRTHLPMLMLAVLGSGLAAPVAYPWGGPVIKRLASESYTLRGLKEPAFDAWLADAYTKSGVPLGEGATLTAALDARAAELKAAQGDQKVQLARDTAQWAHTFIKKAIPKFSLERGFEFASAVQTGERQCLLQSVIIASLLQRVGLDAGAVMVWKNDKGAESNLGHVVTLLSLPDGRDLLVDASDPQPFMRHQGLMLRDAGVYRFVSPTYAADDSITAFVRADGRGRLTPSQAQALDLAYLRSQFDYYRGERAPGGFMGPSTAAGLAESAKFLKRAIKENPDNALATSVLGHVYRKQKQDAAARKQYEQAQNLYQAQGHVPSGQQEALAWARGKPLKASAGAK